MIVKRKKTKVIDKPGNKGIESEKEVERKQPGFYEKKETKFKSNFKKFKKNYKDVMSDSFMGLFDNLEY